MLKTRKQQKFIVKTMHFMENTTLSDAMVMKWVRSFKDGLTNIHEVHWSGWSAIITEDLSQKAGKKWNTTDDLRFHRYKITFVKCQEVFSMKQWPDAYILETDMLSKGIALFLANYRHTRLIKLKSSPVHFSGNNWIILCMSPDLALTDYHLFLHLRMHLGGQRHDDGDVVKTTVLLWFSNQACMRMIFKIWLHDTIGVLIVMAIM